MSAYQAPDFRSGYVAESVGQLPSGEVTNFHDLHFSWFLLFFLVTPPVLCLIYAFCEILWIKSVKMAGKDGHKMERIEYMHLQLDGVDSDCLFVPHFSN